MASVRLFGRLDSLVARVAQQVVDDRVYRRDFIIDASLTLGSLITGVLILASFAALQGLEKPVAS
jgi:hypothetical protein